jgi:GNAT superfamily N-acetyltransferase
VTPEQAKGFYIETMAGAKPVETGRESGDLLVLCAHIIATMGRGEVVTDYDMDYPRDWKEPGSSNTTEVGHQQVGRTVCLHSFAVSPKLQGGGIGKLAMMSYLQILNESGKADRVSLIAQEVRRLAAARLTTMTNDASVWLTIIRSLALSTAERAKLHLAVVVGMTW